MKDLEISLEEKLHKKCKENGIMCIKGISNSNGYPDRIVFNTKIQEIHYIEFKNNTNYTQTTQQKAWQKIIENSGGIYLIIETLEELDLYIKTFIERK